MAIKASSIAGRGRVGIKPSSYSTIDTIDIFSSSGAVNDLPFFSVTGNVGVGTTLTDVLNISGKGTISYLKLQHASLGTGNQLQIIVDGVTALDINPSFSSDNMMVLIGGSLFTHDGTDGVLRAVAPPISYDTSFVLKVKNSVASATYSAIYMNFFED